MKKTIIIILIAVVVLGGGGAAAWYFLKAPKAPVVSYYVPGDYFVTNIKDSKSLLKTTIVLELSRDDVEDYLTEHNHIIRDVIVFTLRDKTEDELRSDGIQDQLRSEIVTAIEKKLDIDYITTVYFNDYIIQ